MTFKIWKYWVKDIPWVRKWFVLLVLLRPLIDNFYFLKEISPFLSPLYWVGILTPFLCLLGIQNKKKIRSTVDKVYYLWFFSVFLSVLFISYNNNESFLFYLSAVFKIITPLFLFLFLRRFIQNRRDLEGVLYTFYLSFFIVIGLLIYEIIFNPIRITYRSEGVERIQGNFGDVASYGMYISLAILIIFYFQLKKIYSKLKTISAYQIYIIYFIVIVALPKLNHAATTICLLVIFIYFTRHIGKKSFGIVLLISSIIIPLIIFFGESIYSNFIMPLYGKEINMFQGEGNEDQLMHGRVGRLKMLYELWVDYPVIDKLFGSVVSKLQYWLILSSGTHNDFVRNLMLGGIVGLFNYLLFLFSVLFKIRKYKKELKFLGIGSFLLLFLYSITLTPSLYPNFMYIVFAIFAYFSLPYDYNLNYDNFYNNSNFDKKNHFSR